MINEQPPLTVGALLSFVLSVIHIIPVYGAKEQSSPNVREIRGENINIENKFEVNIR